jgi:hypothetical protein
MMSILNVVILVGLIKSGRLQERKKALAVLGRLKGIHVAVVARCLQMSMHYYRGRPPSQKRSQNTCAAPVFAASLATILPRDQSNLLEDG